MVSKEDWNAAMDSEIFRSYAANELQKAALKPAEKMIDLAEQMAALEAMENQIKSSPKSLQTFKALQNKFASDPEYTAKVKKSFVEAVMLLDLTTENE